MVELFRGLQTDGGKLAEQTVVMRCTEQKHNFLKERSKRYDCEDDDFKKVVLGTLYGCQMFERDLQSRNWKLNVQKAQAWESKMLVKLQSKNDIQGYYADLLEQTGQEQIDPSQYLLSESCSTPQGNHNATDEESKHDLLESKILRKH